MSSELIEREDLKTLLGIGETTLCKLVKNGRLPAHAREGTGEKVNMPQARISLSP